MSQTPLWESMPLAKLGKPSNGQKERPEPVRRGGRLSVSFITVEMPETCAPKRWAELQGRSVGGGTSGGGGRGGHALVTAEGLVSRWGGTRGSCCAMPGPRLQSEERAPTRTWTGEP